MIRMDSEIQNASAPQEPDPPETSANARALYDYVSFAYQEHRDARDQLRSHTHKIILLLVASIAAIGAGVKMVVSAPSVPLWLLIVAFLSCGVAFYMVGRAFWHAINLFRFEESPLPASNELDEVLQHERFHRRPNPDVLRDLAICLVKTNQGYDTKSKEIADRANELNQMMLQSFVSTMTFLALAAFALFLSAML